MISLNATINFESSARAVPQPEAAIVNQPRAAIGKNQ